MARPPEEARQAKAAKFAVIIREARLRILAIALVASFAALSAAQADGTCASKAVDKNGKPLAGAAKDANVKKCVSDAVG